MYLDLPDSARISSNRLEEPQADFYAWLESQGDDRDTMKATRHERDCQLFRHERREDIERDFIDWESPARLARQYKLGSRSTVTRHAREFDLFSKRDRNIRAVDLNQLFDKTSRAEIQRYATAGDLPAWFEQTVSGTINHSEEKGWGAD